MNVTSKYVGRMRAVSKRAIPQEACVNNNINDPVRIDGSDLLEFLNQGGTLWVALGGHVIVENATDLDAVDVESWARIRRSTGVAYKRIRPINVRDHSVLNWVKPRYIDPQ